MSPSDAELRGPGQQAAESLTASKEDRCGSSFPSWQPPP
jgi:hypothetical protein